MAPLCILSMPQEIMLCVLSYLDLPDLAVLVKASPALGALAQDPILHRNRIRIIAPSRVQHSLFAAGPHGDSLRPTVGDLIHRDVIRGLGMERRWRIGAYFYSASSVQQYESGLRLARRHASNIISLQLRRRTSTSRQSFLSALHTSHVLPDIESSLITVSSRLVPVIRQLKWSIQRDQLSKMVRTGHRAFSEKKKGQRFVEEGERMRLVV